MVKYATIEKESREKKRMMRAIAVTGTRKLEGGQTEQVMRELKEIDLGSGYWHMGDATGVDALALRMAQVKGTAYELHEKNPSLPPKVQGAERSTRMVKALAAMGGTLHAFVNKPCPAGLKPGRSWGKAAGSGTWGTVAIAVGHGLKVELHPLTEDAIAPDWMKTTQLSLL